METSSNQPQNNSADPNLKPIHTYASDMADAVRENQASVIKIALAEKEKYEREQMYKQSQGTPLSKTFLIFGGLILIVGAIVGSYFLFRKSQTAPVVEQPIKEIDTLISYNEKAYIDVTNNKTESDIADSIKVDVEKAGKVGSIKSLFLTEHINNADQLLPLKDFLFLLNTQAPPALIRTLDESHMVGTYTDANSKTHLFLIFKVKDFNLAYASMLEWEKTMLRDLFILFNTDVSGTRNSLFDKSWKDIIINNKDVRILYDEGGNDVLFYIFTDKNTLVITDSKDAIIEISTRLIDKNTKPL